MVSADLIYVHNCKTFLSLQSRFLIYILARLLGEHNRKKGITENNVYGCTLEYARAYILATQQTLRRGLKGDQFGKKLFFLALLEDGDRILELTHMAAARPRLLLHVTSLPCLSNETKIFIELNSYFLQVSSFLNFTMAS